jgi:hypothetical protein
LLKTLAKC